MSDATKENQLVFEDIKTSDMEQRIDLKHLCWMAWAAALFNAFLIVPDSINVEHSQARLAIILVRLLYSAALVALAILAPRIRNMSAYAWLITSYELSGIALFMFVYRAYEQPSFLIQTMGLMIILIVIFFVPHTLIETILMACTAILLFGAFTMDRLTRFDLVDVIAGHVYLVMTTILCALFAFYRNRNAQRAKLARKKLQRLSETDQLTGLANRHKFVLEYDRWLAWSRRRKAPLFFSFFDIDRFKSINDHLGHSQADGVLIRLAEVIQTKLRQYDVFARWGGDEFVLLLPDTSLEQGKHILDRMLQSIRDEPFHEDIDLSCSFGAVAMFEGLPLDEALRLADERMYHCKKEGGNGFSITANASRP